MSDSDAERAGGILVNAGRRRLAIRCAFCKAEQKADTGVSLRDSYGRHLRNCGTFAASLRKAEATGMAPKMTREQVIDGILDRSGLQAPNKTRTELQALRARVESDTTLSDGERTTYLVEIEELLGKLPAPVASA